GALIWGVWSTRSRGAEAILHPRDGQGAKDDSPDQSDESIRVVGQGFVAGWAGWPGEDLDLGEGLELDVDGARLQLLETARGRQEAAVERPDGAVVRLESALQRRREQAVGGQDQNRHLRAAREGLPVLLARERIDVRAQLRGVRLQVRLAIGFRRLDRLQIGLERDLRVEEDRLLAGQADRDVGPQDAIGKLRDGLLVEVDVGAQPREFEGPAQLRLAPAAALRRRPQRGGQPRGLVAQLLLLGGEGAHLLGEPRRGDVARLLQLADLLVYPAERFFHGPHHLFYGAS